MAVVKANGYGHGLASSPRRSRTPMRLPWRAPKRDCGCAPPVSPQPITLLEGFFAADELAVLQSEILSPVIHSDHQLRLLETHAAQAPASVWVKLDTGMHRVGFAPDRLPDVLARLRKLNAIREIRVLTHFANADAVADPLTRTQIEAFGSNVNGLGLEASLANSAAIVAWPDSHADWVRPASCSTAPRRSSARARTNSISNRS